MHDHSTHMPTEFPLILTGGIGLAGIAGYVNVVVISAGGPAVTHVTGSISQICSEAGNGWQHGVLLMIGIVASFGLGAIASGAIVGAHTLRVGRPYGIAALCEGALLVGAAAMLPNSVQWAACLAAGAAGLQNAFASAYRGMVIRTTHTTGILTDLGFLTGERLRGHRVSAWRFVLLAGLLVGFVAGGITGAFAWDLMGAYALHIVGGPMLVVGGTYFWWRMTQQRSAESAEAGDGA